MKFIFQINSTMLMFEYGEEDYMHLAILLKEMEYVIYKINYMNSTGYNQEIIDLVDEVKQHLDGWYNNFISDLDFIYREYIINEKNGYLYNCILDYNLHNKLYKHKDVKIIKEINEKYNELYYIYHNAWYDRNTSGVIIIDKTYFNKNIDKYKQYAIINKTFTDYRLYEDEFKIPNDEIGLYKLILDIPIKHYRKILKSFYHYYEKIFQRDVVDELLFYNNMYETLTRENKFEYLEYYTKKNIKNIVDI